MPVKLLELYQMDIRPGMDQNSRSKGELEADLGPMTERRDKLEDGDRERFDVVSLWNPYADSGLLFAGPDRIISGVPWGMDMPPTEVLLADEVEAKGVEILPCSGLIKVERK